jgi:hypothetical protein
MLLLLDSQENYKAAIYHSFNSSSSSSSLTHTNSTSETIGNNKTFFNQNFDFNHNRTKQTIKFLFQFLVYDLPTSLAQRAYDFVEEASVYIDEAATHSSSSNSFTLKLFVALVFLLGFILFGVAVSWRFFSRYIESFDFQEFHNRKLKVIYFSYRKISLIVSR